MNWQIGDAASLFGTQDTSDGAPPLRLPRAVAGLIPLIVCHRDPERYALLYTLIWRITRGERALTDNPSDPLVHRLHLLRKAVARDLHKMHAFLRFRQVAGDRDDRSGDRASSLPLGEGALLRSGAASEAAAEGEGVAVPHGGAALSVHRAATSPSGAGERFVAWFEPEHHILAAAAPFFVARFRALVWTILTPDGSARWDGDTLAFGPPGRREDLPEGDGFEAGWRDYYENIFNPARLNLDAMRAEMPKKYWRNMPETAAIPELVRNAAARTAAMIERAPQMPTKREPARALAAMADQEPDSLEALNAIIRRSEPLVPGATQAVLGEGPVGAAIAFVGEQPGDQEDLQGRPFVGPAGQLFSRAMKEAGLTRTDAYVTNAVKHFKFELRGKRRIHAKPSASEVSHYRWWLDRELDFVGPKVVVALGATAVLALAGKAVPITRNRGPFGFGDKRFQGFITVHPSYLLRLPDEEAKATAFEAFVDDLRRVGELVA